MGSFHQHSQSQFLKHSLIIEVFGLQMRQMNFIAFIFLGFGRGILHQDQVFLLEKGVLLLELDQSDVGLMFLFEIELALVFLVYFGLVIFLQRAVVALETPVLTLLEVLLDLREPLKVLFQETLLWWAGLDWSQFTPKILTPFGQNPSQFIAVHNSLVLAFRRPEELRDVVIGRRRRFHSILFIKHSIYGKSSNQQSRSFPMPLCHLSQELSLSNGLFDNTSQEPSSPYYVARLLLKAIEHPHGVIVCSNCKLIVTEIPSILAEPSNRDYCVGCFSKLHQLPDESYYVRSSLQETITETGWTILNEVQLLHTVERWGYGNWSQIKNHLDFLGTNFSTAELERHYNQFYLQNVSGKPVLSKYTMQFRKNHLLDLSASTSSDDSQSLRVTPLKEGAFGYNPRRMQFAFEFDNEAEDMLANLQFHRSDTEAQVQIKLRLIKEYNSRLEERYCKREFVLEHKLFDIQHNRKQMLQPISQHHRQSQLFLRPFMRYNTFQTHQRLVYGVAQHSKQRGIINGLNSCRKAVFDGKVESAFNLIAQKIQRKNASSLEVDSGKSRNRLSQEIVLKFNSLKKKEGEDLESSVKKKLQAAGLKGRVDVFVL